MALVAFALAGFRVFSSVYALAVKPDAQSGALGAGYSIVFGVIPFLLWTAFYVLMWLLLKETPAKRWMTGAFVFWVTATITANFGWVAGVTVGLSQAMQLAIPAVFAIGTLLEVLRDACLAMAIWKSGMFDRWVSVAALSWAGVHALTYAVRLSSSISFVTGIGSGFTQQLLTGLTLYVTGAAVTVTLLGIGLNLFGRGKTMASIEAT